MLISPGKCEAITVISRSLFSFLSVSAEVSPMTPAPTMTIEFDIERCSMEINMWADAISSEYLRRGIYVPYPDGNTPGRE